MQADASALDDKDAGDVITGGGFEDAGQLRPVDLADRTADKLPDLGGEIDRCATEFGAADHEPVVERNRNVELGKIRAHHALGWRKELNERARID